MMYMDPENAEKVLAIVFDQMEAASHRLWSQIDQLEQNKRDVIEHLRTVQSRVRVLAKELGEERAQEVCTSNGLGWETL